MQEQLLAHLRCPVTRGKLSVEVHTKGTKVYDGITTDIILEGMLFSAEGRWFYPVIGGIPRLTVEACIDYSEFCVAHLRDYNERMEAIRQSHGGLLRFVVGKNRRTKASFAQEWGLFNYASDKTWDADPPAMLKRFLNETAETETSIKDKLIFDAGCGNGLLNRLIAEKGAFILGMDFSASVERAFANNSSAKAWFIQGDVQFPPVAFEQFNIVHSSGVLICTNNTELSFSCIDPCVKPGGKLSVWLYHPRRDVIHNLFNFVRRFTSRLPIRLQYYLYLVTIFPLSWIVKRLKGNRQNAREMMIDILDWFSPEFRWEHTHDEAAAWFQKRGYEAPVVTTNETFGFNITGVKRLKG